MKLMHRIPAVVCAIMATALIGAAHSGMQTIDVQHSTITVYVYKQGLFSFLADNHTIDAPIASGSYDAATKAVELTVDAAKLTVLDPKLEPGTRAKVQSNTIGPQVLDAGRYPTITFRSTSIRDGDPKHWMVTGNLTLHGQTHPITFQVVRLDSTHFTGSATVRQTQFGITPIRVAGGSVAVKDEVKIDFAIALSP